MRFLIGQIAHETNTFSNVATTKELFEWWEWDRGQGIIDRHQGVEDYLGGMIARARELEIELAPAFSAFATPSGTITHDTYLQLKNTLLTEIQQAGSVDAVCLALHGAGVAEAVDDIEGDLLAVVRRAVGANTPIVVTLDLHGNLTQEMVDHADILLGVNFYPHTDSADRGREAVDVALRIARGQLQPIMHLAKLPLMIPTSTTNLSPAKDINELCWAWEARDGIVDCTFFHGFPMTDVPCAGVSILAAAHRDEALAQEAAQSVATAVWAQRRAFFPDLPTPEAGIQIALASLSRPVVINETSDNPGGGTPGDGTHLLRAMLEAELTDACFGFIYDPDVAALAHETGAGAYIDVELGGKTDHLHGAPLAVHAYVKCLTDGRFLQSSPMWRGSKVNLGKSVRLQIDGLDVIVCSVRSQVFDEQVFLLHGIDVTLRKIVALKSSQHFRAAYEQVSDHIVTVDSPGLSTMRIQSFGHRRIARPIYPLDEGGFDGCTT